MPSTDRTERREPRVAALYALAHRKIEQESYQDAAALLRLMLHVAPIDERAWLGLGLCHERIGQLNVARELYATGTVAAKPSGRCALACARVLARQGLDDAAISLYETAIDAFESVDQPELATVARKELQGKPWMETRR